MRNAMNRDELFLGTSTNPQYPLQSLIWKATRVAPEEIFRGALLLFWSKIMWGQTDGF